MTQRDDVEISVVVPVFNEQELIARFASHVVSILKDESRCFEILFIDDGSTDLTWQRLSQVAESTSEVRCIRLARNYGKEIALYAGLAAARGRAHIPMDVDFQDPPELIPVMIERWREGNQQVIPIRRERADGVFRSGLSKVFHKLTQGALSPEQRGDVGDFRLLDATVTARFLKMEETRRFNKGLFAELGGTTAYVDFSRPNSSRSGRPSQSIEKLLDLAQVALFQHSAQLLRRITLFSALVAAVLALLIPVSVVLWIFGLITVPGQATTIVFGLAVLVVQVLSFGLLALFLGDISVEVKRRPLYFIQDQT